MQWHHIQNSYCPVYTKLNIKRRFTFFFLYGIFIMFTQGRTRLKSKKQRQPDTIPYYNVNVLCTTQIVASDVQPWMVIGDGIDNAVFRKISWGGKLFGQLQVALFPCSLINKRSSGRQSLMGISLRRRSWITLVFLLHSISRNDNSASRRLMIRTLISFAFQQRINICSGYSRTALLLGNQQILQKLP